MDSSTVPGDTDGGLWNCWYSDTGGSPRSEEAEVTGRS